MSRGLAGIPTLAIGLGIAATAVLLLVSGGAFAEVLVPTPPPESAVVDKELAASCYASALEDFEAGDFESALRWAERTYAALPNASAATIVATILSETGSHREAFSWWLVALTLEPNAARRTLIEQGIQRDGAAARPRLGWLRVDNAPPDAEVTIDGKHTAPAGVPLGIRAGSHRVRVKAPDFEVTAVTVETVAGLGRGITIPMKPAVKFSVSPAASEDSGADLGLVGWVTLGGGAAVAAVGAGLLLWAIDASDDAARYTQPVTGLTREQRAAHYRVAAANATDRANASYVLFAVGGAAAAAGVVLVLLGTGGSDEDSVTWTPTVAPGRAGMLVRARF